MEFRTLKANEIECRIATVKSNGISLLLYKDARCDMNILDETVGKLNWKREHSRDNANCTVSIWDDDKSGFPKKIQERKALLKNRKALHPTALRELALIGESEESYIPHRLFGSHPINAKFPRNRMVMEALVMIVSE